MSRKLVPLSITAALLGGTAMADAPNVAVDIAPVHSLVARVMEGVGTPDLIIPAGASPHEYNLRPSEASALQEADVVFWIGEDLTPWLEGAVETLSDGATVTTLLESDGTVLLDFRENALFEAHDHGDHDDHGHDDHGHGHGEHAFEWAGLFDLKAGDYVWSFAKVDGDYADPAMKMVVLSADDIEAVEETAEELLESEASEAKADGEVLAANNVAYALNFSPEQDRTLFTVSIAEDGKYAFFTEHMPFEFEADEHFFKDADGADVEPVAQEPDVDHHDHDHGSEEHAGHDDHDHDHAKDDDHAHDDHGHDDHAHDDHAGHDDHDDHGHDDHADHDDHAHEGHAHGEHDPHAWLSPANAETWLNVIAAQLSSADPDNAGAYFANAAAAREELAALSAEIAETLEPVKGGSFIVFHDAYQYFEDAFDFPASGAISIGDASDPSPARIAEIQGRIREEGVGCVMTEPQFNPGIVATVLEGTEANTGVMDPLGSNLEPGASLYPQLMRNMANTLAECL